MVTLVHISLISLFAMMFGMRYLQNKENMAMIQNGIDPGLRPRAYYINLKWGLLLIGTGIGLFLAYILDNAVLNFQRYGVRNFNSEAIYLSMIAIFGGLALFISYLIEKKETLDK